MRKKLAFAFLAVLYVFTTACTSDDARMEQEAQTAQILPQMQRALEQESFRFDGSASLRGDNFNQQNIVTFTGYVDEGERTYLRLLTPQEEHGIMEDMDLYADGRDMYMRFADQVDWEQIGDTTPLLEAEMNHWNPLAHIARMQSIGKRIELVETKGNITTIRVVLDEEALKREFLDNIRERIDSFESVGRENMIQSLSTAQAGEQGILEELDGLHDALKLDASNLEQTTQISGLYTVHIDKQRKLPTQMTYLQTTDYSEDGRNVTERSQIDITVSRYGERTPPTDLPRNGNR